MATDINAINPELPINNKYAVCSTTPTGHSAKLLVRPNYPGDLIIENIESKYDDRFDDVSYYTIGNNIIVGG